MGLVLSGLAGWAAAEEAVMSLTLTSPAFKPNDGIPAEYTCEGRDISPPLAWAGVPEGTKSLVLIVDDPDAPDPAAPRMTWVHWVVYDMSPGTVGLTENADRQGLPAGARKGINDWKRPGYGGPCPPIGRHRYFHKLYALDKMLGNLGQATKQDVEAAMEGHVLARTELVGTFQKTR